MDAVKAFRRWSLVALILGVAALGGLLVSLAISSPAAATPQETPQLSAPLQTVPAEPRVETNSGVVSQGECFVTTQKALEGPILITVTQPITGTLPNLLREVEVIKVISACHTGTGQSDEPASRTPIVSRVETIVVICVKPEDLSSAECTTE